MMWLRFRHSNGLFFVVPAPEEGICFAQFKAMRTILKSYPQLKVFSLILFLAVFSSRTRAQGPDLSDTESVMKQARINLGELQRSDGAWNFGSYLGTQYTGLYFLSLDWLGRSQEFPAERAELAKTLIQTQLSSGGWYAVKDANLSTIEQVDINASILNYWFLKSTGLKANDEILLKAKAAIHAKGGLEASSLFSKIFLALFNNASWGHVPHIPFFLFKENNFTQVSEKDFAQWIGPHLLPIAYLKSLKVQRTLGSAYQVDELALNSKRWAGFRKKDEQRFRYHSDGKNGLRAVRIDSPDETFAKFSKRYHSWYKYIVSKQQSSGSWGGYTLATFLSTMSLNDYLSRTQKIASEKKVSIENLSALESQVHSKIELGIQYCSKMKLQKKLSGYLKGITQDGRYWDTALAGIAILDSNSDNSSSKDSQNSLYAAADYLVSIQSPNGGFAFGKDFEYAPDVDDTAEIIMFLHRVDKEKYSSNIDRGAQWMRTMQNKDGGWGAFDLNNDGNFLLRTMTSDFLDSADMFDESSPDVTGHVMEAFGKLGLANSQNDKFIQSAVKYLAKSRDKQLKIWSGRWGLNYIYGSSAAVIGLLAVGESADSKLIKEAVAWLETKQNKDGGFGETTKSYKDKRYAGRGMSTPSQSAWAMLTLMEANGNREVIDRTAAYLVKDFQRKQKWIDHSVVGTGHPGIVYMDYSSYPYAWPLSALGKYLMH